MGRSSKAGKSLVLASPRTTARREPPSARDLAYEAAREHEARFLEARRGLVRDTVDAVVAMGGILRAARHALGAGYLPWVSDRLGIDRTTAANYVVVAELARHSPAVIERHQDLGVTRLYRLGRLPPEPRAAVLATPGLARLTDSEFATLLAGSEAPPARRVTGNMRGHGLRIKAHAMVEKLREQRAPRIADPQMRAAVKEQLLELSRAARELADKIR